MARIMSRSECDYRPENGRFMLECDFSQQYHHYYRKRLAKARPLLEFNCRQKWDHSIPICNLAEISSCDAETCIIFGTIFKRMKLQPSAINELCKGNFEISSERYLGHFTSQDDTLTLEDDEESIQLVGKIEPKNYVTGITVALLGSPLNDGGRFCVDDVCFATPSYQLSSARIHREQINSKPTYLLIVSGLGFHHEMDRNDKLTKALQDFIDFIWGGGKFLDDERSSRVSRVLVVGDSLHDDRFPLQDNGDEGESSKDAIAKKMRQSRQVKPYTESLKAVEHMDHFFAQLCKTINVDVMPGESDPSSHLMPQQPLHPCMFPKSSVFPTFNCTTNPHHAIYNDIEILATAGQNVNIVKSFSGLSDPIEIMRCHLKWGNNAPSAPDNLYSVPYEDEDPFIIDAAPDIYIAGCQDSFRCEYHICRAADKDSQDEVKTLLLTIPRFNKTFSCVLLDLESARTQLLAFD